MSRDHAGASTFVHADESQATSKRSLKADSSSSSLLLPFLPKRHQFRVIFLRRDLNDTIDSQNRLRARLTGMQPEPREITRVELQKHLEQTYELLDNAPNVQWIEIQFEKLLQRSDEELGRLASFCGFDPGRIEEIKSVIKPASVAAEAN